MFTISEPHFVARVKVAEEAANALLAIGLPQRRSAVGFKRGAAVSIVAAKILIQPAFSAKLGDLKAAG
jgi:hypothetical protein